MRRLPPAQTIDGSEVGEWSYSHSGFFDAVVEHIAGAITVRVVGSVVTRVTRAAMRRVAGATVVENRK